MKAIHRFRIARTLTFSILVAAVACDDSPTGQDEEVAEAVQAMRTATASYHDLDHALEDGFVLVHGCEVRPGEGQVGAVYVQPDRMPLGIDPSVPQGLLYEIDDQGNATLLGAELVVPYDLWTEDEPPEFLGMPLQPEDEFGVYGLHAWVWRENPRGMFAQAHPGVACDAEEEEHEEP